MNRVIETTLERFDEAGVELVDPVSIPNLTTRLGETSLYEFQSRHDVTAFLGSLDDAPIDSFDDFYDRGAYHENLTSIDRIADGPDDPFGQVEYWEAVEAQQEFHRVILSAFAEPDLDAIAFPDTKAVPRYYADLLGDETEENYLINTFIASQSSCPAISAGWVHRDRAPGRYRTRGDALQRIAATVTAGRLRVPNRHTQATCNDAPLADRSNRVAQ